MIGINGPLAVETTPATVTVPPTMLNMVVLLVLPLYPKPPSASTILLAVVLLTEDSHLVLSLVSSLEPLLEVLFCLL